MRFRLSLCAFAMVMALLAKAANPDFPNLEEVILTTKCHLDVGYTSTVPELARKYGSDHVRRGMALFESERAKAADMRTRWIVPGWAVEAILDGDCARLPEFRAKLDDAIRSRLLSWHALPYTLETESSDLEEMVRMFKDCSGLSRRYGMDIPRYVKQTDVPDQGWALTTVLANAGVKFLHIGINDGCKQPAKLAKIPPLCWWEGPDGSRILLGYCPNYGEYRGKKFTLPKTWRHKTLLIFCMRGDNAGPMSSREVNEMLSKVRKKFPGVKVRFGDPVDFADAIIAEEREKPTLPVVRGDMPDTWIHGAMTTPEATGLHRRVQGDLVTLGVMDTTLRTFGMKTENVADSLANGYRLSGLYSEHTWGFRAAGVRGPKLFQPDWRSRYEAGEYRQFDESFEYHMDYARKASSIVREGIASRIVALARSVMVDGPRVVVFNPLPYERDAVVTVDVPEWVSMPGAVRDGGKLTFLAKGIPAGGYKTFAAVAGRPPYHVDDGRAGRPRPADAARPEAAPCQGDDGRAVAPRPPLRTRHFTVRFDLEKGGIASLVDNATGRELVKQGGHVLGQFLHERFSQNEVKRYADSYNQRAKNDAFLKKGMPPPDKSPYAAITPKGWSATHVRNAIGDVVALTADDTHGLAKGYELRFSFPDHAAYVDISWKVTEKKPDPIPEGGWICLPFNVASPSFRVGRIGGTIDPVKDIIFAANRNLMCVDRAITVRTGERGAGVGVASADLPLWSLGKPGLWLYEPDYVPAEPEVFANLYNNQWNTNYPLWIPGSWSASLRVYPVAEGADEEQTVFTPAWEIRQPCVAAFAGGNDFGVESASVQQQGEGVAVSRKGVRLTAFCPNPDGAGIVLRVWEQAGVGGEIAVTLPKGMNVTMAQPVNLRGEREGGAIEIRDGRFSFNLGPWAPKSFVLLIENRQ